MSRVRALWLTLALGFACAASSPVQAQPPAAESEPLDESTDFEAAGGLYAPFLREHYYRVLSRSPTKSFLWELALPGAGHIYNGFPIQAGVAIGLSALGAALWIAGAARDLPPLGWVGMTTFGVGRVYGLISAPVTATLLNAAYRRQFGIKDRS
jgi:hypothetical protein